MRASARGRQASVASASEPQREPSATSSQDPWQDETLLGDLVRGAAASSTGRDIPRSRLSAPSSTPRADVRERSPRRAEDRERTSRHGEAEGSGWDTSVELCQVFYVDLQTPFDDIPDRIDGSMLGRCDSLGFFVRREDQSSWSETTRDHYRCHGC